MCDMQAMDSKHKATPLTEEEAVVWMAEEEDPVTQTRTHARSHARTHARTHERTHARTHTRTPTRLRYPERRVRRD